MEAYLVTDRRMASGDSLPRLLRQAAAAGVERIQIREIVPGGRALLGLVREVLEAARGTRATIFVHDRVDVALAAGAPGAHLEGTGLPPDAVRRIGGEDLVLGVQAGTMEEAVMAEERGADYLFFGPVFPSAADPGSPPAGIPNLEAVLRRIRIPVYAAGGIGPENLERFRGLPLAGVAMTSAFLRAPSLPDLVRQIHEIPWK